MPRTERYVIGLVETLVGPADSVRRFPWAVGDPSPTTGKKALLPFDGVWGSRKLIVEVDEEQHTEATPFFDKPGKLTVSGVYRGDQRRRYDERKRSEAKARGYTLVAIPWSRKRKPMPGDLAEVRGILRAAGIELTPA